MRVGSESRLSDILSQIMSTSRSNTAFTLIFSLADVSKNSSPGNRISLNLENSLNERKSVINEAMDPLNIR